MNQSKTVGGIALLVMGILFLCVGGLLGGYGGILALAATAPDTANPRAQLVTGIVMIVVGLLIWTAAAVGAFLAWRRMQPKPEQKITIRQEIDLTGDIDLAALTCQKCNAALNKDAITVKEGAALVVCPYCGATYQMVEEPKW